MQLDPPGAFVCVPGFTTVASDSFVVSVTNSFATSTATVSVALNGDPLLTNQWHIQNVGQNAFATTLPVAGMDLNVTGAWTAGFSGKGGRGVAYNATLRGYNLLATGAFSVANMAKAMGSDPVSADNDLFNASFSASGNSGPTALAPLHTVECYPIPGLQRRAPFDGTHH